MTTNANNAPVTLKSLRFGVELETCGLNREQCANAIAAALGGRAVYVGGHYQKWNVVLTDGRKWTCMTDGSLYDNNGGSSRTAEVVSPILTWADMAMLAAVCDALKGAGAYVNETCGMHVHVDGARFTAKSLANLATTVWARDSFITAALGIETRRGGAYCRNTPDAVVKALRDAKDIEGARAAWYGTLRDSYRAPSDHYHASRYHGLNLHSFFYRGTVEFRWFAGTVTAAEARANVVLCLALAAFALNATSTRMDRFVFDNVVAKTEMYRWLTMRLDVKGAEFAADRKALMARLPGVFMSSTAYNAQRRVIAARAA